MQSHAYSFNSLRHNNFAFETNEPAAIYADLYCSNTKILVCDEGSNFKSVLEKSFILPGITSLWVSAWLSINKTIHSTSVGVRQRLFGPGSCLQCSAAPLLKTCFLIAVCKSLYIVKVRGKGNEKKTLHFSSFSA